MLSDEEIMSGGTRRCMVLHWVSHLTQGVCRSTLAAKASHLASAMELTGFVAHFLPQPEISPPKIKILI